MSGPDVDVKALAADWLRALRGRRSQVAFSRRLGYRSNIAYRWEAGHCFPTASATLGMVERSGSDVEGCLAAFYRARPPWLDGTHPCSVPGVARLLDDLRGEATLVDLARRSGYSRFAVTRWLRGRADPTLPEFLTLIECTSRRLLDFVASFVDPEQLPSVRESWRLLQGARQAAYDEPWSHAVLRALELEEYRALAAHEAGWIARRLGISLELERASLVVLHRARQVLFTGSHYVPTKIQSVDTRADPERARQLRAGWARVGVERLAAGSPGVLSYNLSTVSRAGMQRLETLQRAYYREMVNIIAESAPAECVVLYAAELLELRSDGAAPDDAGGA